MLGETGWYVLEVTAACFCIWAIAPKTSFFSQLAGVFLKAMMWGFGLYALLFYGGMAACQSCGMGIIILWFGCIILAGAFGIYKVINGLRVLYKKRAVSTQNE